MSYRTMRYALSLFLTWVKANPCVALARKLTNAKANLTMPDGLTCVMVRDSSAPITYAFCMYTFDCLATSTCSQVYL